MEAFVQLRLTVCTDGAIKNIVILKLIGPKEFATSAIDAIKDRKFAPATLNGQPVDQSRSRAIYIRFSGRPGAHISVVDAYNDAVKMIKEQKYDEAVASLTKMDADPKLSLYDRGMLANLLSAILILKGDFLTARNVVELPTTWFASKLPLGALKSLIRSRILADLGTGDIPDAVRFTAALMQTKDFDLADPLVKQVEDARIKFEAAPQFAILRKVPQIDEGGADYFPLTRRTFSFTITSGSLDKFSMDCRQQTIKSKITEKAEWHVPKDWDQCRLLVEGTPGTVFQINEFSD